MKVAIFVGSNIPYTFHSFLDKFLGDDVYIISTEKTKKSIPIQYHWIECKKQFFSKIYEVKSSLKEVGIEKLVVYNSFFPKLQSSDKLIERVAYIDEVGFLNQPKLYSFFEKRRLLKKIKNQITFSNQIIVPTQTVKDIILKHFKCNSDINIEFSYYGKNNSGALNQSIALPDRFILHESHLSKKDNIFNLIQAIENLDIVLVLLGPENSYLKKVLRYTKKKKFSDRIIHLKNVNTTDYSLIYQKCEWIVDPSFLNYSGYLLAKAFQYQKPIILSNNVGFHEVSIDFPVFIETGQKIDLCAKNSFLWNNESERNRRVDFIKS